MGKPTRLTSHGVFFVSTQCWDRRRLFQVEAHASLFLETLQHYRTSGYYRLYGFVVMPDHVHLPIMPTGVTLERGHDADQGVGFRIGCRRGFRFGRGDLLTTGFGIGRISGAPGVSAPQSGSGSVVFVARGLGLVFCLPGPGSPQRLKPLGWGGGWHG